MTAQSLEWVGLELAGRRYSVADKIGEGGMGYVYRAQDRRLNTWVVLKVPRAAILEDPDAVQRFLREIRSLVQLAHPHVVRITDVGKHEGIPYAVMQYLSGGSLEDRRQTGEHGSPLPIVPSELRSWLPDVAKALDFVHAQGYVHRDVKPANILFDDHGNVYLSDFGVIKALAAEGRQTQSTAITGQGMVLGTPEYMAPEVIMGEAYDGRADQYALGVVIYELLCGRTPFQASTPTAILVRQIKDSAPELESLLPGIPKSLSDAVKKSLAKNPEDRFCSCTAFAQAVVAGLEGMSGSNGERLVTTAVVGQRAGKKNKLLGVLARLFAMLLLYIQRLWRAEWWRISPRRVLTWLGTAAGFLVVGGGRLVAWITVGLPTATVRMIDGLLRRLAGEGNAVLHNFLRLMLILVPVTAYAISRTEWLKPVKPKMSLSLQGISDQTLVVGNTMHVSAKSTARNIKGSPRFLLAKAPPGAAIDSRFGEITWQAGTPGVYRVVVRVTAEGSHLTDEEAFTIRVVPKDAPPVFASIPDQAIEEGSAWTLTADLAEMGYPRGEPEFIPSSLLPDGMALDSKTGVLTWTPTSEQAGRRYEIRVAARNGAAPRLRGETSFSIDVTFRRPFIAPIRDVSVRAAPAPAAPPSTVPSLPVAEKQETQTQESTLDLTGEWQTPDGASYEFRHEGEKLRVNLIQSPTLYGMTASLSREGSFMKGDGTMTINVSGSYFSRQTKDFDVSLKFAVPDDRTPSFIVMDVDEPVLKAGRSIGTRSNHYEFTRVTTPSIEGPPRGRRRGR
ncbi:MAG: protein kinase [Rhodopirellula sp.]|nr:protein kinase [Rhodopirellula sp.]